MNVYFSSRVTLSFACDIAFLWAAVFVVGFLGRLNPFKHTNTCNRIHAIGFGEEESGEWMRESAKDTRRHTHTKKKIIDAANMDSNGKNKM